MSLQGLSRRKAFVFIDGRDGSCSQTSINIDWHLSAQNLPIWPLGPGYTTDGEVKAGTELDMASWKQGQSIYIVISAQINCVCYAKGLGSRPHDRMSQNAEQFLEIFSLQIICNDDVHMQRVRSPSPWLPLEPLIWF